MRTTITLLFFLVSFIAISQSITARLIDKSSQKPIPYANIKTGENAGTISNDEGFFTVPFEDETKTITISCMGYENKILTVKEIKKLDFVIELKETLNQLDEVFISNTRPNANAIIAKVKTKLAENYSYDLNAYNIFHRFTDHMDFEKLECEIDKASHVKKKQLEAANRDLKNLAEQVKHSNMVQFSDVKGKVFTLNKDSIKLKVEKATLLLDHKKNFSIDNIQEKTQNIILKYLDTTKTYKLKSGLFKIEDSLALNDEEFKDKKINEHKVALLNNKVKSILGLSQFHSESFLSKILNTSLYEYALEDMGYNNGELTYIISFIPKKGKAKYTGKIYVCDDTYAITRLDFNYYKNRHGQKVNLKLILGIKYIENMSEGTLIFERDSTNMYHPKYIKHTAGSYFYVSRPLKFIENSDDRYKVGFEFKIEGSNNSKEELLITGHRELTFLDFQAERQAEKAPIQVLNAYEKTIWDDEGILAPSLEMKAFEESK